MDCARLTPKETDLCITLSLSGSTHAQILTHLKKLNSDNCSITTTIYNCMVKFRLKQLAGRTRMQKLLDDDDQQLQKGLAEVFPEATNLLCAFHIKRNICANFKTSMNKDTPENLEKIKGDWDVLWMSGSYTMYRINLECVERSWGKMYPKWISYDMNNAWLTNEIKICASFEKKKSKNIGLHEHRCSPYIKHLGYHVSRTALDFILREIKSLSNRDPGHCQHLIRKTMGFPVFVRYLNIIAWVKYFSSIVLMNIGKNSHWYRSIRRWWEM
ncbi:hypothetical protein MKW98_013147 [Papaver atlanticum]|uniref:MULE transposase domain-containing protein n=1 Tax=Papaver atlanticum TaxID=357466 RepID=A0AAD4T5X6_9MAGN|nr:hypothetical protein MKW98_013147 [Papaver atlanticum]